MCVASGIVIYTVGIFFCVWAIIMDKGNRIVFLTLGTLGNILSRRQIDFFIYRRLTLSMLGKILPAEVLIYYFFLQKLDLDFSCKIA